MEMQDWRRESRSFVWRAGIHRVLVSRDDSWVRKASSLDLREAKLTKELVFAPRMGPRADEKVVIPRSVEISCDEGAEERKCDK